jgi:hypothetical protein
MSRLLLTNIEPGTTDDDIRAFLEKYGFPPADPEIERPEGDGSRPSALLTYTGIDSAILTNLQTRIQDMYWNKRTLTAQVLQDRFA